jgi:hypothetical protein
VRQFEAIYLSNLPNKSQPKKKGKERDDWRIIEMDMECESEDKNVTKLLSGDLLTQFFDELGLQGCEMVPTCSVSLFTLELLCFFFGEIICK